MVSAGEQCFKAGQQLVNFPLREVSHWVSQFHMGFTRFKSCLTLFNQLNPSIRETESDRVGQSRTDRRTEPRKEKESTGSTGLLGDTDPASADFSWFMLIQHGSTWLKYVEVSGGLCMSLRLRNCCHQRTWKNCGKSCWRCTQPGFEWLEMVRTNMLEI